MPNLKLTFETKITLEVENEEELQMALRNMPGLNVTPIGFGSAQNNVKRVVSSQYGGSLADGEKAMIQNAIDTCETKTGQAAMLGITRTTLNSKIKQYGL